MSPTAVLSERDAKVRARAAIEIGQQCSSPSSAFFVGYQLAMRCLDSALALDQWAAFCVNEKGLASLRQMSTTWCDHTQHLNGQKSFALMAGSGLDQAIVIARPAGQSEASDLHDLVAVKVSLPSSQVLTTVPLTPAKLLPELPHGRLEFQQYKTTGLWRHDAHHQVNKPFRYWEDVMVILAFSGWMTGHLSSNKCHALSRAVDSLIDVFSTQHQGYDFQSLNLIGEIFAHLTAVEAFLPASLLASWRRDQQILTLGQRARDQIRRRLK